MLNEVRIIYLFLIGHAGHFSLAPENNQLPIHHYSEFSIDVFEVRA